MAHARWPFTLYQVALLAYPAPFRRAFGSQLLLDAEDAVADARDRGPAAVGMLWCRTYADLVRAACVQRTRAGWPIVHVTATIVSTMAFATSMRIYRAAWRRVENHGDDAVALALVGLSVLLWLFICTLTFTTVFGRRRVSSRLTGAIRKR